jgi:hypothetical protein
LGNKKTPGGHGGIYGGKAGHKANKDLSGNVPYGRIKPSVKVRKDTQLLDLELMKTVNIEPGYLNRFWLVREVPLRRLP